MAKSFLGFFFSFSCHKPFLLVNMGLCLLGFAQVDFLLVSPVRLNWTKLDLVPSHWTTLDSFPACRNTSVTHGASVSIYQVLVSKFGICKELFGDLLKRQGPTWRDFIWGKGMQAVIWIKRLPNAILIWASLCHLSRNISQSRSLLIFQKISCQSWTWYDLLLVRHRCI